MNRSIIVNFGSSRPHNCYNCLVYRDGLSCGISAILKHVIGFIIQRKQYSMLTRIFVTVIAECECHVLGAIFDRCRKSMNRSIIVNFGSSRPDNRYLSRINNHGCAEICCSVDSIVRVIYSDNGNRIRTCVNSACCRIVRKIQCISVNLLDYCCNHCTCCAGRVCVGRIARPRNFDNLRLNGKRLCVASYYAGKCIVGIIK